MTLSSWSRVIIWEWLIGSRLMTHDFAPPGGETAAEKVKDAIREERGEVQIVHLNIQVLVPWCFKNIDLNSPGHMAGRCRRCWAVLSKGRERGNFPRQPRRLQSEANQILKRFQKVWCLWNCWYAFYLIWNNSVSTMVFCRWYRWCLTTSRTSCSLTSLEFDGLQREHLVRKTVTKKNLQCRFYNVDSTYKYQLWYLI